MLRKISFVDGLDIGPIIFDCDFSELGLVLVVPGPQPSSLLFGESTGAGNSIFSSVAHLDIERNIAFVLGFGVTFHNREVLLIFATGSL